MIAPYIALCIGKGEEIYYIFAAKMRCIVA